MSWHESNLRRREVNCIRTTSDPADRRMSMNIKTLCPLILGCFLVASCTAPEQTRRNEEPLDATAPADKRSDPADHIEVARALFGRWNDIEEAAPTASGPRDRPSEGANHLKLVETLASDRYQLTKVQATQATLVETRSQSHSYNAAKPSGRPAVYFREGAADWRYLGFASGFKAVKAGIDANLLAVSESSQPDARLFAFLLPNATLTEKEHEQLRQAGVKVLGRHSHAFKVQLPNDAGRIQRLGKLEFVHWVGLASVDQKIDPSLASVFGADIASDTLLPVYVNVFGAAGDAFNPRFLETLRSDGIRVIDRDSRLQMLSVLATKSQVKSLATLNNVLYIEVDNPVEPYLKEAVPSVGADYYRWGLSGVSIPIGVIDSGFSVPPGASPGHDDLFNKSACGKNFSGGSQSEVWVDGSGHGTGVLGIISGTGDLYRDHQGIAPGAGISILDKLRLAKWGNTQKSLLGSLKYMNEASACGGSKPLIVNLSGGSPTVSSGTDKVSRRVDANTWDHAILHVNAAGNSGSAPDTVGTPESAKTAFSIGHIAESGNIVSTSSRGPTADKRMKPNIVAVGSMRRHQNPLFGGYPYTLDSGTSFAAPLVTGIAARAMEFDPELKGKPAVVRALLMASAIRRSGDLPFDYGLGELSSVTASWNRDHPDGWYSGFTSANISATQAASVNITVAQGVSKLIAVLTWDEPEASSGAGKAVLSDLDLYVDQGATCGSTNCGNFVSDSTNDNVEYVIVDRPPAGTYRLSIHNWDVVRAGARAGLAWTVIRGNEKGELEIDIPSSPHFAAIPIFTRNGEFSFPVNVTNNSYIASNVRVQVEFSDQSDFSQIAKVTTLKDGASSFRSGLTSFLGDIVASDSRQLLISGTVNSGGQRSVKITAESSNGEVVERSFLLNFVQEPLISR